MWIFELNIGVYKWMSAMARESVTWGAQGPRIKHILAAQLKIGLQVRCARTCLKFPQSFKIWDCPVRCGHWIVVYNCAEWRFFKEARGVYIWPIIEIGLIVFSEKGEWDLSAAFYLIKNIDPSQSNRWSKVSGFIKSSISEATFRICICYTCTQVFTVVLKGLPGRF